MIRLRIKEVAEEKGISIAKLARKADLDSKTVYRIANDPYAEISTITLGRLAEALEVSVKDLVQPGVNTFQPRWKRTGEHRAVLRNRWYKITRCIGRCLEDRMVCRPDLEVLYALPAPVISFSPNSS